MYASGSERPHVLSCHGTAQRHHHHMPKILRNTYLQTVFLLHHWSYISRVGEPRFSFSVSLVKALDRCSGNPYVAAVTIHTDGIKMIGGMAQAMKDKKKPYSSANLFVIGSNCIYMPARLPRQEQSCIGGDVQGSFV